MNAPSITPLAATLALVLAVSGCATVEPRTPRIERLPEGAAGPIAPAASRPLSLAQVVEMARANTPANVIVQSLRDSRATYSISVAEAGDLAAKGVPDEVIEYLRRGDLRPVLAYPPPRYGPYYPVPAYGYAPRYFYPGWVYGGYPRYPRSGLYLQFGLRR